MAIKFLNTATGITEAAGDNSTKIATTAYVDAAAAAVPIGDYLPLAGGTLTGNLGMGVSPLTAGGSAKWITLNGTSTYGGGLISSISGVAKGYVYSEGGSMLLQAVAGEGIKLLANGSNSLIIDTSHNATFSGTVLATNLSGTNTGDQDLSGYLLNTTDDFNGTLNIFGGNNNSKESFINVKRGNGQGEWLKFQTDATSSNNVSEFVIRRNSDSVNLISIAASTGATSFAGDLTVSGGNITLGGTGRIQGVDTVSATTDAANKAYVDAHGGGLGPFLKDTTDTFTGSLTIIGDIRGSGQQLILNAGESYSYATGQTNEYVYANAENGLEVNSSPDNWASGWAGRNTSTINNASGSSFFYNHITVGGNQYFNGELIEGDGKEMFKYNDAWLRINEDNDFSSGIYCGSGVLRTDGAFQVGALGTKFLVTAAGAVTAEGTLTLDNGQIVLGGTGRIQGVDTVSASTDAANKAYVDTQGTNFLQNEGSFISGDTLIEILETDTTADVRIKLNSASGSLVRIDDYTAPAGGCFQLNNAYISFTLPQFHKLDDDQEYTFELWGKYVSGTDTNQLTYLGSSFYGSTKNYLGNSQRYWGESSFAIDSDTNNDGWYFMSGTLGPDRGSDTGDIPTAAHWMKLIMLLNYQTQANTVRYCGLKVYKSGKKGANKVTSIYRKTLGSQASSSAGDWIGNVVLDTNGSLFGTNGNFTGDLTVSGGDIVLGGTGRIQGVDTVSASTDAANKAYVDAHGGGLGPFLKDTTDTFTGTLTLSGNSSSAYKALIIENASASWAYTEYKSGSNLFHTAFSSNAQTGAPANSMHFRPNGTPTALYVNSASVGVNTSLVVSKSIAAGWLSTFTNTSTSGHGLLIQAGGTSGTRYITQWKDAAGTERFHMDDTGEANFQNSVTAPTFVGALSGNATTASTATTSNLIKVNDYSGSVNMRILGSHQTGGSDTVYSNASMYLNCDTGIINATGVTVTGILTASQVGNSSSTTRDKLRVWGSSDYTIGMMSGYGYGGLGGNGTGVNYAMSFQMNSDVNRGFWWGDSSHTNLQGAMSLTTTGKAVIATSLSIGYGESTRTAATQALEVNGTVYATPVTYSPNQSEYVLKMGASNSTLFDQGIKLKSDSGGSSYISINARSEDTLVLRAGKVGIGTPSPQHLLHISDDTGLGFAMERTGSAPSTYTISNSSARITHNYVGGANGYRWQVEGTMRLDLLENGNLYLNSSTAQKIGGGSWGNYSDERIKKDISNYTKGLDEILSINPVTYKYNGKANIKSEKQFVGIIAQEIKKVLPSTIEVTPAKLNDEDEFDTDLLTFDASELTFTLINAVKELKAEIEELKKQINK